MMTTIIVTAAMLLAPPPADPPAPVQCKDVNMAHVCRYADGSVQACSPFYGCQPVYVQLTPDFWSQP
jgi:hypothetical protein